MELREKNIFIVSQEYHGCRLDKFILSNIPDIPKSLVYSHIRKGLIKVNNAKFLFNTLLNEGDEVSHIIKNSCKFQNNFFNKNYENIFNKYTIYSNDSMCIINKPYGVSSQGGSKSNSYNISNVIKYGSCDKFLVHRLDKNTTGMMIIAKGKSNATFLSDLFRKQKIKKSYLTIVYSHVKIKNDVINKDIRYDKSGRIVLDEKSKSYHNLKKVSTRYKVLQYSKKRSLLPLTLLEVFPITGRKHQIRYHLSYIGHSILGDNKYNNSNGKIFDRYSLCLHSYSLYVPITSGKNGIFACLKPPFYFLDVYSKFFEQQVTFPCFVKELES